MSDEVASTLSWIYHSEVGVWTRTVRRKSTAGGWRRVEAFWIEMAPGHFAQLREVTPRESEVRSDKVEVAGENDGGDPHVLWGRLCRSGSSVHFSEGESVMEASRSPPTALRVLSTCASTCAEVFRDGTLRTLATTGWRSLDSP